MRTILAAKAGTTMTAPARPRRTRPARDRLTSMYLTVGALAIASSVAFPQLETIVFLVLGVATAASVVGSVRVRRPAVVWPWACLVVAFALFIVGGAARSSLGTMGDLTETRSLLPDMIALPGYLLLVVALLGFSRSRVRGEAQTSVVLDALIAALAMGSL